MGCGPSHVEPAGNLDNKPGDKPAQNGAIKNGNKPNNGIKKSTTDSNANSQDTITNNPVPKSIAFTVDLDGQETKQQKLFAAPPPRLKRLDPLNVPKLTAEELAEKQRQADEKRDAQIKRKQSASLKASRRRQQILEAQKFDKELQQKEVEGKISDSLSSAGKSRESKLKDIQDKQRIREERAKRAREKVKKMNDLDHELDIDVEKDEDYNADEADSWLEGDNNNNSDARSADSGERIYSGRSSPQKRANTKGLNRGISANTIDSFDNAYNRKPPSGSHIMSNGTNESQPDDFFDS